MTRSAMFRESGLDSSPMKEVTMKLLLIKSGSNKETSGLITKPPDLVSGDEFCNCSP